MNRKAILSATSLIIFCLSVGQILLSFASHNPTTIYSSGIVKEKVVEPTRIRKHLVAYVVGFTDETADFIASNFDIVITNSFAGSTINKIKALNPNLTVLGYGAFMGIQPYSSIFNEVDTHEEWFLHDVHGNRLINKKWGWYALDVGNSGWRTYYADFVKDKLDKYPFDGFFADDTWNIFSNDRWTVAPSDIPVEIGQRWHSDMVGMIVVVKRTIGNKLLIVNTSNNEDYVDACDGKMEEGFVHAAWWSLDVFGDNWYNWKGKVDALKNISQRGKYYLAHSGTVISESPTEAELDKVRDTMMYCLASYFLGTSGEKASFGFNNIYSKDGSRGYYPEFDVSLGSPTNDYYLLASVYSRDFKKGKVLVNPTTSSCIVDLDGEYKTLDGEKVSNITLGAHSGVILLNS